MKNFAWSWSRLKNYRVCPKRMYHVDLQKDFKEEEGEQLIWGNEVHKALAERVSKGASLPITMEHYEPWGYRTAALKNIMDVKVEQKLAMSEQFKPTGFFDNKTWFRGVADVLAIKGPVAMTLDWKTGKIQPDYEQLALSAQLVFVHYPEVKMVETAYVWLGHDDETVKKYRREDMVQTWNNLWPEIKAMAEAHRTLTYPPKPSRICKRWCPVTSCPHHGKSYDNPA
jgi:PD-(D/E)XK nuclease superfamily